MISKLASIFAPFRPSSKTRGADDRRKRISTNHFWASTRDTAAISQEWHENLLSIKRYDGCACNRW